MLPITAAATIGVFPFRSLPAKRAAPESNQGIAPPSNADLIAIIRAKDDLICQLKTAALETDRLRDRVEQLEQLVGVDRSLTSRLRTAFGLEPGVAQVMGMLLKRD